MIPSHLNENEVLDLIGKIAKILAPKFCFAYYDKDDIIQEAYLIGLECLERHDPERSALETFLWTHINNRLKSFKRDNYIRPAPKNTQEDSVAYKEWEAKYARKKNLLEPISISTVDDTNEKSMNINYDFFNDLDASEVFFIIDMELPIEFREDYLRMKQGITISKPRREKIHEIIAAILTEYGYEVG